MALACCIGAIMLTPAVAQIVAPIALTRTQIVRLQRMQGVFAYESGFDEAAAKSAVAAATPTLVTRSQRRLRVQLLEVLRPALRVKIQLENSGTLSARMAVQEGTARISAPLSGALESVKVARASSKPSSLNLSQRLDGSTLLQIVEGKGVRQERRFDLSTSGTILILDARVMSTAANGPLTARSVYRKL